MTASDTAVTFVGPLRRAVGGQSIGEEQFGTFVDHAIADLLRRPSLFDPRDHGLAQVWMSDQFALHRPTLVRLQLSGMTKVARVLLWKGIIRPEVTFDLAKDRRFVTLEDACHLSDRYLCVTPGLDLTAFSQ